MSSCRVSVCMLTSIDTHELSHVSCNLFGSYERVKHYNDVTPTINTDVVNLSNSVFQGLSRIEYLLQFIPHVDTLAHTPSAVSSQAYMCSHLILVHEHPDAG